MNNYTAPKMVDILKKVILLPQQFKIHCTLGASGSGSFHDQMIDIRSRCPKHKTAYPNYVSEDSPFANGKPDLT